MLHQSLNIQSNFSVLQVNRNLLNTINKSITLTVQPDNQAQDGLTLNNLLLYLQWYNAPETWEENPEREYLEWTEKLDREGLSISRTGEYITNPIQIILPEGEYEINNFIRVYTIAD